MNYYSSSLQKSRNSGTNLKQRNSLGRTFDFSIQILQTYKRYVFWLRIIVKNWNAH